MRKGRLLKVGGPVGLLVLAFLGHPEHVLAASGTIKDASPLCNYPVLQQLCGLGKLVTSGVNSATSGVTQDFLSSITSWVAGAAAWVLDHLITMVQSTSTVNLNGAWFKAHYSQMIVLSAFVMLPVLAIAAVKAAFTGEGGRLAVAVFFFLPFSIVLTFVAIPIVNGIIGTVDWMSSAASSTLGVDYNAFVHNISTAIGGTGGSALVAPFVALISSIFIVVLGLMLVVVMMSRNAQVYITAVLIPFALAPMVIPGMEGIARKLFALLVGSILIKFLIVVSISIGVAALGAGTQCDPNGQNCNSFSTVLAGIAILATSIVLPYNIIQMLIVSPILSQAASQATIFNSARSAAALPMGSSEQIYAGIRHNTGARLASGGIGGSSGTRLPRLPGGGGGSAGSAGRSFAGGGGGGRPTVIDVPGRAVGSTGGMRNGSFTPRSSFFGRVRSLGGQAASAGASNAGKGVRRSFGKFPKTPRS